MCLLFISFELFVCVMFFRFRFYCVFYAFGVCFLNKQPKLSKFDTLLITAAF